MVNTFTVDVANGDSDTSTSALTAEATSSDGISTVSATLKASDASGTVRSITDQVWATDFDNPDLLRTKIKEVTTVCLIPAQRTALLGETPADAETRHRDCETQFKR